MSGIVGIYHPDGGLVDRLILDQLTHSMAFRGPDGLAAWSSGSVGFGHTLLRTTHQAAREKQPCSLPRSSSASQAHELAIVADARIDCRTQLRAALASSAQPSPADATDPELILAAYCAWGEACVHHLRGDFAFAIWDARGKKLFCARDHFGLKPFYYAAPLSGFVFSNTLHTLLLHPSVSSELNDSAIADFLLFGMNYDASATPFRDIRRLPPSHALTVSPEGIKVHRYWQPPTTESIRYRDERDYVLHFREIFRESVCDRLQTGRIGILLSGGLDSGSVAATASDIARASADPRELRAYTITFESLLGDREGHFARKTAAFLDIPLRCIEMDDPLIFPRNSGASVAPSEPSIDSLLGSPSRHLRIVAADCRVALSGEGSDNLMDFEMWPYVRYLADNRQWFELVNHTAQFLRVRRFPWRGLRARARRWFGARSDSTTFPSWISSDLARRLNLRDRWDRGNPLPRTPSHPLIPRGYASLSLPHWANMFESDDPGATGCNVEVRYPFLDLRMVHYLLALPPFPWFFKKTLIRQSMVGRLPEEIRVRSKVPLQGDPVAVLLRKSVDAGEVLPWDADLQQFLGDFTLSAMKNRISMARNGQERELALRPFCLSFWLQSLRPYRLKHGSPRSSV